MAVILEYKNTPRAKARPRFARCGNYMKAYKLKDEQIEEDAFKYEVKRQLKRQGVYKPFGKGVAISISAVFVFPMPKSYSKVRKQRLLGTLHTKRPDTDNVLKFYLDGLNGILYEDDSQVCEYVKIKKIWGYAGKVRIIATQASEEDEHVQPKKETLDS